MATLDPMDDPAIVPEATEGRLPFSPAVGCLVSILAGLACAGAFFLILWVNQQGQFVYAPQPYRAVRIWILRGAEGGGIGLSTTRPLPGGTADRECAETRVGFLFLGGGVPEADTIYCECFALKDGSWTLDGACPE